jgi:predicted Rossmann fold nucleotide-binding protein DprA/Smf involved in DNA uptake
MVAGMSLGVMVIEGAEFSGSLITALLAMELAEKSLGSRGM